MSTDKPPRPRPASRGPQSRSHYSVGYAKPPMEYCFKPGQSGNGKGRPRGAKNTATIAHELLNQKIEVRTGDTLRKMTVRQAILTRFAEAALKGDTKRRRSCCNSKKNT